MARDPEERGFDEVAIVLVAAQVTESMDADEPLVGQEPVERLVEEAGVAAPPSGRAGWSARRRRAAPTGPMRMPLAGV
jgi:hypothetical protein